MNDSAPTIGMPCVLATVAASLTVLTAPMLFKSVVAQNSPITMSAFAPTCEALERTVVRLDRELQPVLVAQFGEAIVVVLGEQIADRAAEIPQESFGHLAAADVAAGSASAGRESDRSRGV